MYRASEVAGYTRVPASTLRTWAFGRTSPKRYPAVIKAADKRNTECLSFINLIEAHVLVALRHTHNVPLKKIKSAVSWLKKETGKEHPLAELEIDTNGLNVFVQHFGDIVSASEQGQIHIREVVEKFLERVERDRHGMPVLFYPFTFDNIDRECPKDVVISPVVGFGRPVVNGTRISTSIIFERYTAGESITEIAKDYDLELRPVEEALRCEIEQRAA